MNYLKQKKIRIDLKGIVLNTIVLNQKPSEVIALSVVVGEVEVVWCRIFEEEDVDE
jgi:hypothetical protein